MKVHARHRGGFRWEGVEIEAYKPEGQAFEGVTRQRLFGAGAAELRYFEVAPGGWTTLERHRHRHEVMVLCGEGRALVGSQILSLAPFDLVRVPASTWHQFRAGDEGALGFLCLVDRERDRPERPGPEELAALRVDPALAAFLRV